MTTSLTPRVAIRAAYARLALTNAAKHDIRFYLRGLLVEPRTEGGAFIVATDGRALIAIIDEQATCSERALLQPDARMAALLPKLGTKGDRERAQLQLVRFDDRDALTVTDADGQPIALQLRDATIKEVPPERPGACGMQFPDWRRVLPSWPNLKPGAVNTYNHAFMQRAMAAVHVNRYGAQPLRVWQAAPDSAMAVNLCGHDNVLLLVMPIRAEANEDAGWQKAWRDVPLPKQPEQPEAAPQKAETDAVAA
jgi:DNA polymerase-3 subunit beta